MRDAYERSPIQTANIRTLLLDVAAWLEKDTQHMATSAGFAAIRPSDARMFASIADRPRTISQLARAMNISRQAAHSSIGRLMEWNAVELRHAPGSRRDKVAILTEKGLKARQATQARLKAMESLIENKIGVERLELLRTLLLDLASDVDERETVRPLC